MLHSFGKAIEIITVCHQIRRADNPPDLLAALYRMLDNISKRVDMPTEINNQNVNNSSNVMLNNKSQQIGTKITQNNQPISGSLDLPSISLELAQLRQAVLAEVLANSSNTQLASALGKVADAEESAKNGDGSKMIEHLKSAGKLTWDIGSKLALPLLGALIKDYFTEAS